MVSRVFERITWILWVLTVAALPFTSLTLVSEITGSTSVAPGSLLFAIPLILLLIPSIISSWQALPFQVKPALVFFLYLFLTISLAFFRDIPDYKDQTITSAAIEGIATLGLGLVFFLVFVSTPNSRIKIERTIRILNWSGLALIIWSIVTFFIKEDMGILYEIFHFIQDIFTTTKFFEGRMVGFAAEPSWLAHMLNLVYIAYWLAATINKISVHNFRIWKFTFENLLLIGGIVVLIGTLSRGGLAAFMLVVAFLFVLLNMRFVRWLSNKWKINRRTFLITLLSLGIVVMYLLLLVAGVFVLSKLDPRMEDVFRFNTQVDNPIIKYAEELQFGERIVYWQTGWNIFDAHPILGVGVGFSGFYFPDYLADAGWGLTETRKLLYNSTNLMNIKNMWVRLLAESGIVGFVLFLTVLIITVFTAVEMIRSKPGLRRTVGYMGIFMLIAIVLEEFSVDSFALPYVWFTLGLVAAVWRWYLPEKGDVNG